MFALRKTLHSFRYYSTVHQIIQICNSKKIDSVSGMDYVTSEIRHTFDEPRLEEFWNWLEGNKASVRCPLLTSLINKSDALQRPDIAFKIFQIYKSHFNCKNYESIIRVQMGRKSADLRATLLGLLNSRLEETEKEELVNRIYYKLEEKGFYDCVPLLYEYLLKQGEKKKEPIKESEFYATVLKSYRELKEYREIWKVYERIRKDGVDWTEKLSKEMVLGLIASKNVKGVETVMFHFEESVMRTTRTMRFHLLEAMILGYTYLQQKDQMDHLQKAAKKARKFEDDLDRYQWVNQSFLKAFAKWNHTHGIKRMTQMTHEKKVFKLDTLLHLIRYFASIGDFTKVEELAQHPNCTKQCQALLQLYKYKQSDDHNIPMNLVSLYAFIDLQMHEKVEECIHELLNCENNELIIQEAVPVYIDYLLSNNRLQETQKVYEKYKTSFSVRQKMLCVYSQRNVPLAKNLFQDMRKHRLSYEAYAALIDAFCSIRDYPLVVEVLTEMKRFEIPLRKNVFVALIELFIALNDRENCLSCLAKMEADNFPIEDIKKKVDSAFPPPEKEQPVPKRITPPAFNRKRTSSPSQV